MVRHARSEEAPNPDFTPLIRKSGETNLQWSERAVRQLHAKDDKDDWTYVALLGGKDTMSFRLRVAQSHLRKDLLPSLWSQSILVELKAPSIDGAKAIHVPLAQPGGREFATRNNGVVSQPLSDFDDPDLYPNIALIAMPVAQQDILDQVQRFKTARSAFDSLEYVLRWLAFSWGAAKTPNPLHENYGLPSACMLDTVCSAARYDLTPGLESRASCPEAIYVAVRYWTTYYKELAGKAPKGRFFAPHRYDILEPPDARPRGGSGGGGQPPRPRRASTEKPKGKAARSSTRG